MFFIGDFHGEITIEDCLEKVENRFQLVHLAAKRVKQLKEGQDALVKSRNKDIVTSLREIAAGKVVLSKERVRLRRILVVPFISFTFFLLGKAILRT